MKKEWKFQRLTLFLLKSTRFEKLDGLGIKSSTSKPGNEEIFISYLFMRNLTNLEPKEIAKLMNNNHSMEKLSTFIKSLCVSQIAKGKPIEAIKSTSKKRKMKSELKETSQSIQYEYSQDFSIYFK